MKRAFLCLLSLLLALATSACGAITPTPEPPVVKIHASLATQAWQSALFACASQQGVVLALSEPAAAEIELRVGEPAALTTHAFQLDSEDVLVIVHPANPLRQLTAAQVVDLFSGQVTDWAQIEASQAGQVQVWVFPGEEDVQEVFAQTLAGRPIVSTARVATSPEAMAAAIASDQNSIGLLSRHWKAGNVAEVLTAASAPVLAITPAKPSAAASQLLACAQQQKTAP